MFLIVVHVFVYCHDMSFMQICEWKCKHTINRRIDTNQYLFKKLKLWYYTIFWCPGGEDTEVTVPALPSNRTTVDPGRPTFESANQRTSIGEENLRSFPRFNVPSNPAIVEVPIRESNLSTWRKIYICALVLCSFFFLCIKSPHSILNFCLWSLSSTISYGFLCSSSKFSFIAIS